MKFLIMIPIMFLLGCATAEQQCNDETLTGKFESYQACLTYHQQQDQAQAQAFQNLGNTLKQQQQQSVQSPSFLDAGCYSQCLGAGYSPGLCNSKCKY